MDEGLGGVLPGDAARVDERYGQFSEGQEVIVM